MQIFSHPSLSTIHFKHMCMSVYVVICISKQF